VSAYRGAAEGAAGGGGGAGGRRPSRARRDGRVELLRDERVRGERPAPARDAVPLLTGSGDESPQRPGHAVVVVAPGDPRGRGRHLRPRVGWGDARAGERK